MRTRRLFNVTVTLVLATGVAACGSSGGTSTPTTPSTGGNTPVATTTITITSSGASPRNITVSPGSRVTFVNNDGRVHEMTSDPHPEHTQCPEINQVGFLSAGQSRATGNLNTVRTCGFHDHGEPGNQSLTGTIRIQ